MEEVKCEFHNCDKPSVGYSHLCLCEEHVINVMLGGNKANVDKIVAYLKWKEVYKK